MLRKITRSEFDEIKGKTLFERSDYSKCYGILELNLIPWKIQWSSELMTPQIFFIKEDYCFVGIDLNISLIDLKSMSCVFFLELDSFFVNAIYKDKYLYVFSELKGYKMEIENLSLSYAFFPEICIKGTIQNGKATITTIAQEVLEIDSLMWFSSDNTKLNKYVL
jgi:hypothetical protein